MIQFNFYISRKATQVLAEEPTVDLVGPPHPEHHCDGNQAKNDTWPWHQDWVDDTWQHLCQVEQRHPDQESQQDDQRTNKAVELMLDLRTE